MSGRRVMRKLRRGDEGWAPLRHEFTDNSERQELKDRLIALHQHLSRWAEVRYTREG